MRLQDPQTQELPKTIREQMAELAKYLNSIKDRDPSVQAVLSLLGLLLDEARDRLITADPQNFPTRQGEAIAYRGLIAKINTPPPKIEDF